MVELSAGFLVLTDLGLTLRHRVTKQRIDHPESASFSRVTQTTSNR